MKQTLQGVKSAPFADLDIKKYNLLVPTTVTQGTPSVTKLHFPVVGFDALFEQLAGPVANAGTLGGVLEESDDDGTYITVKDIHGADVALTAGVGAGNVQQVMVHISKPYVRYTATVSVSTGTVDVAASLIA